MTAGDKMYEYAKKIIPGGTNLYSKRPELYAPGQWPAYYQRAKGIKIWDTDGNVYRDFSTSGIGTCPLGYADDEINRAVIDALRNGSMSSLNCPEDLWLAERLLVRHPWADMVRYTRSGGEAMAVAVRIARAATGRDVIAYCGYHGWHDWYLAANLRPRSLDNHLLQGLSSDGVPGVLNRTAYPFDFNDYGSLERIVAIANVAAIVMEPVRNITPSHGFLRGVRSLARTCGAVLIFDEITSGWRMTDGGIHMNYNVYPDIAVFGKAMSNGYPMAAVIGKREVMEAAKKTFISSTYWTERIGPTAAIATLDKFKRENVAEHLVRIGEQVQKGWEFAATSAGIPITVTGIPPLAHFELNIEGKDVAHTLFVQLMLEKGYLAKNAFYASFAHQPEDVDLYLQHVHDAFKQIKAWYDKGTMRDNLRGEVANPDFYRMT